eukprot:1160901-Pelagomonas_calceolata.AAC.7
MRALLCNEPAQSEKEQRQACMESHSSMVWQGLCASTFAAWNSSFTSLARNRPQGGMMSTRFYTACEAQQQDVDVLEASVGVKQKAHKRAHKRQKWGMNSVRPQHLEDSAGC